jgi:hypothetical protein
MSMNIILWSFTLVTVSRVSEILKSVPIVGFAPPFWADLETGGKDSISLVSSVSIIY